MRAFTRNASSRDELKDEEDPASPTTPLDYSGTTSGLKGRPTARFSSIELVFIRHRRDAANATQSTQARAPGLPAFLRLRRHLHHPLRLAWRYLDSQ